MQKEIILASASPRRRELLAYTGVPFRIESADVEEIQSGAPEELVQENAYIKGQTVFKKNPGAVVLSADTVVFADGKVLGKPSDQSDAARMLRLLSGNWHEVFTGVTLFTPQGVLKGIDISRVHFVPLEEQEIVRYVQSGEPMDKAGAYALQGIGGMFVDRIEGSYSNVIGLPMALVRTFLLKAGIVL